MEKEVLWLISSLWWCRLAMLSERRVWLWNFPWPFLKSLAIAGQGGF
jgi:hypothetical protein